MPIVARGRYVPLNACVVGARFCPFPPDRNRTSGNVCYSKCFLFLFFCLVQTVSGVGGQKEKGQGGAGTEIMVPE
jgi:hypothetical protein